MIQIHKVNKSYQDGKQRKSILIDLELSVQDEKHVAITGESGSGKSTLLHLLAAVDKPDSGTIKVDDLLISQFSTSQADDYRRQHLGLVFQRFNLIECLNVWDNICFPARINSQVEQDYIQSLLDELGLSALKNKMPQALSGGEQQRVAIARALAHKPKLLLADEPTGNLDDKNSDKVANLLFRLCTLNNTFLVLVTHSLQLAKRADCHYLLRNGRLSLQHE
ncbi:ABC transporter ATP-binding protein [Aliiglaciecola litoralis]|uniref:ABC transporter ATP-binding protein n=1 Tax=Aliiglaciecola litoralis TaxID=582857 RepID=A0ABP3X0Y9_9ALTE